VFKQNRKKVIILFSATLIVIPFDIVLAKPYVDPTRPPGAIVQKKSGTSVSKRTPWRLSSTLIASERKIATINGLLLRQGERVNGATLVNIESWNVTLEKNNKKFKIYMFKNLKIRKNLERK
jgi:hypothetical protein